jgi:hypothetical protein
MKIVAILITSIAALAASLEARAQAPRFASVTIENDFFVGFDRHYTNGLQVAFLVETAALPGALREAAPFSWSADPDLVVAIGQRLFTPDDKSRRHPDPADRPYAGWLYFLADIRVRSDARVADHLTASLGVVGPSALGRQAQNNVHDALGMDPARGWDDQVSDTVAAFVAYERAWPAALQGAFGDGRVDASPRVSASLGNALTYASAGAVLRYGSVLPRDLPATHISLGPPRDGYRGAPRFGWYVWSGIDARIVARNIFLDGHRASDPSVPRRPTGIDVQVGGTFVWPRARVGFTVVQRSREFRGQDKPDRFGQLSLSFAY